MTAPAPLLVPRPLPLASLRLLLISDGQGDLARLAAVLAAAVAGGLRCLQLREPQWSARQLLQAAERLLPLLLPVDGLLLVNDRIDLAAAGCVHGVQLGHRSLPVALARRALGSAPLLGYSAHDADELAAAAAAGCDFALLSPVFPTTSKPGLPHLGLPHAQHYTAAAGLPVVWLGGIGPNEAARIGDLPAGSRPAGIAVRSAVMSATDPQYAVAALLRAFAGG